MHFHSAVTKTSSTYVYIFYINITNLRPLIYLINNVNYTIFYNNFNLSGCNFKAPKSIIMIQFYVGAIVFVALLAKNGLDYFIICWKYNF